MGAAMVCRPMIPRSPLFRQHRSRNRTIQSSISRGPGSEGSGVPGLQPPWFPCRILRYDTDVLAASQASTRRSACETGTTSSCVPCITSTGGPSGLANAHGFASCARSGFSLTGPPSSFSSPETSPSPIRALSAVSSTAGLRRQSVGAAQAMAAQSFEGTPADPQFPSSAGTLSGVAARAVRCAPAEKPATTIRSTSTSRTWDSAHSQRIVAFTSCNLGRIGGLR